jgi:hypothetical protein
LETFWKLIGNNAWNHILRRKLFKGLKEARRLGGQIRILDVGRLKHIYVYVVLSPAPLVL